MDKNDLIEETWIRNLRERMWNDRHCGSIQYLYHVRSKRKFGGAVIFIFRVHTRLEYHVLLRGCILRRRMPNPLTKARRKAFFKSHIRRYGLWNSKSDHPVFEAVEEGCGCDAHVLVKKLWQIVFSWKGQYSRIRSILFL